MKKNKILIFLTILSFLIIPIFTKASVIYDKNTDDYRKYYYIDKDSTSYITNNNQRSFINFGISNLENIFNKFSDEQLNNINNYLNENYGNDTDYKYMFVYSQGNYVLLRFPIDISTSTYDLLSATNSYGYGSTFSSDNIYKTFKYENNTLIETSNVSTAYFLPNQNYGFVMWTDKNYYWKDFLKNGKDNFLYFYRTKDANFTSSRYTTYYDYNVIFEYNEPIYTLMDLVGINRTKPSNKTPTSTEVNYTINYYVDNVLINQYTEEKTGNVGDVITNFTDYEDNSIKLVENDYSLTLSSDVSKNVLNIYYVTLKKIKYKIEYYFDDILRSDYTEHFEGLINDEVTEYTSYASDYWQLVENEYKLILQENEESNVLKIYYRSPNYGTEYQTIDTSNSKIPFIFQFSDIKGMFKGVNFDIFTQSEQLQITIFINIWFVAIFSFITWLILKIVYKVFSLFR